ncbi:MAG: hypothetical protein GY860_02675 [Desulfobacteraceae bacterium]|nr:hypothetical protein [Desulfobacteraceae bacterium]
MEKIQKNSNLISDGIVSVLPAPQYVDWCGEPNYRLNMRDIQHCVMFADYMKVEPAIRMIDETLSEMNIPSLSIVINPASIPEHSLYLAIEPHEEMEHRMRDMDRPGSEGYRMTVDQKGIHILGKDIKGLFYGLITLEQLIDKKGMVPGVEIADWPDMKLRGAYVHQKPDEAVQLIQEFAKKKINTVMYQYLQWEPVHLSQHIFYDAEGEHFSKAVAHVNMVFEKCREYFIEPIYTLSTFSHANETLQYINHNVAEGISYEKKFRVVNNEVYSPPNIPSAPDILNPGFEKSDTDSHEVHGWIQDAPGKTSFVELHNTNPKDLCLKLQSRTGERVSVYQTVDCQETVAFTFRAQVKTENIVQGDASIVIRGVKEDSTLGEELHREATFFGTSDWTDISFEFSTRTYSCIHINLCLEGEQGSVWYDSLYIEGVEGVNDLDNVIMTKSAPTRIWDEYNNELREGTHYQLDKSLLSYPFKIGNRLRIIFVKGSNVKDGQIVRIRYTVGEIRPDIYSMTCCPCEPEYYAIMKSMLGNIINNISHLKFINISHDEISLMRSDLRCKSQGKKPYELLLYEIKQLQEIIHAHNPEIQIMMWGDSTSPYHDPEGIGYPNNELYNAAPLIPKDIIIGNWWYTYPDDKDVINNTLEFYLQLGFTVTGSPWYDPKNAYAWAQSLYEFSKKYKNVLGGIYTSWPIEVPNVKHQDIDEWYALDVFAEYLWTARTP